MKHALVLGGIRSGKSALAESLIATADGPVCYLATATAGDREMTDRIQQHQARRPAHWQLVEEPVALAHAINALHRNDAPALLIDCMSLWLGNLLGQPDGRLKEERDAFLHALTTYPGQVVIVSNEVGLGIIGMDPLTRQFADELGWLNQALAAQCDTVVMAVAGLPQVLKGALPGKTV